MSPRRAGPAPGGEVWTQPLARVGRSGRQLVGRITLRGLLPAPGAGWRVGRMRGASVLDDGVATGGGYRGVGGSTAVLRWRHAEVSSSILAR